MLCLAYTEANSELDCYLVLRFASLCSPNFASLMVCLARTELNRVNIETCFTNENVLL